MTGCSRFFLAAVLGLVLTRAAADDVTDIAERVVGGFLKGNKLPLGDGVDQNDVAFRDTFPYVAAPHAGLDSQLKRTEPIHPGTPGQP